MSDFFEVENMKKVFILFSVIIFALFVLSACSGSDSDSGTDTGTPPAPVYDISVTPPDGLLLKNGEAAKIVTATVTRDGAPASGVILTASGAGLSFRPVEGETDDDGVCVFEVSAATDLQSSGTMSISGESVSGEIAYTVVETTTLTELWGSEVVYGAVTMEGVTSGPVTIATPAEHTLSMQGSAMLHKSAVIASVNAAGDLQFTYDKGFLMEEGGGTYFDTLRITVDGEPSLLAVKINVTDGSAAYPYPIYTKRELQAINYSLQGYYPNLDKHYILMNDISISSDSVPWTPIGSYRYDLKLPFTGYFNGNNHSITDLTGTLFGYIKADVTDPENPPIAVERLHLETPAAGLNFGGGQITGLLANYFEGGVIQYVSAGGKIISSSTSGILINEFHNGGILRRCYSTVDADVQYTVGLLASRFGDGKIEDCYTTGTAETDVSAYTYSNIAGIAAFGAQYFGELNPKVYNTYAAGEMVGYETGGYGGGIASTDTFSSSFGRAEVKNSLALVKSVHINGNPDFSSSMTAEVAKSGVARVASVANPGGGTPTSVELENNYAYDGMDLFVKRVFDNPAIYGGDNGVKNPVDDPDGDDGQGVALLDLTEDFFTRDAASSGLGWSNEIWDFNFTGTERSWKLPIIKGYRETEQKALCLPDHLRADPSYTVNFPHCP
jgi:hypothetical protein